MWLYVTCKTWYRNVLVWHRPYARSVRTCVCESTHSAAADAEWQRKYVHKRKIKRKTKKNNWKRRWTTYHHIETNTQNYRDQVHLFRVCAFDAWLTEWKCICVLAPWISGAKKENTVDATRLNVIMNISLYREGERERERASEIGKLNSSFKLAFRLRYEARIVLRAMETYSLDICSLLHYFLSFLSRWALFFSTVFVWPCFPHAMSLFTSQSRKRNFIIVDVMCFFRSHRISYLSLSLHKCIIFLHNFQLNMRPSSKIILFSSVKWSKIHCLIESLAASSSFAHLILCNGHHFVSPWWWLECTSNNRISTNAVWNTYGIYKWLHFIQ